MWLGASWVTAWLLSGWRITSQRVHLNIYHNLNYGPQFTEFQLFAGSGTGFLCPVCKTEQNYYLLEIALLPWCTTCFIKGIRGPASVIDQGTRPSMRGLLLSLPSKRMSLIWDIVHFLSSLSKNRAFVQDWIEIIRTITFWCYITRKYIKWRVWKSFHNY
jgi:hypothetical protein